MDHQRTPARIIWLTCACVVLFSCNHVEKKPRENDIVSKAEKLPEHIANDLEKTIDYITDNGGKLNDTVSLTYPKLEDSFYSAKNYTAIWNANEKWLPL